MTGPLRDLPLLHQTNAAEAPVLRLTNSANYGLGELDEGAIEVWHFSTVNVAVYSSLSSSVYTRLIDLVDKEASLLRAGFLLKLLCAFSRSQ